MSAQRIKAVRARVEADALWEKAEAMARALADLKAAWQKAENSAARLCAIADAKEEQGVPPVPVSEQVRE